MTFLLSNSADRAQRIEDKRQRLVDWLRQEVYTDYTTAAAVWGVTPSTAFKTLGKMERDELIDRHAVGKSSVWSLTTNGQLLYLAEGDDPQAIFDPRVSEVTVRHTLAVQRARLAAEAAGWAGWQSERGLRRSAAQAVGAGGASPWLRIPDGVCSEPGGKIVAVEIERTAKTPKRYAALMADYLQMRKAGTVEEVHYVCESEKMSSGLHRLFLSIKSLKIKSTEVNLKPEHYDAFKFFTFDTWPG